MQAGVRIHPAIAPWIVFSSFVRKLYIQRGLIRNFVVRDLRTRYVGSFMGFFWSVIHPLVLLASWTFVFLGIFHAQPGPETGTTSFPLFLFCGMLPWLFFSDALQRSSTVVIDNANLVTKTLFPTEILPLTAILSGVVNHLIGFAILLVMIFFVLGKVSVFIFLVPVYFVFLMLFTLGLAWLMAGLNVFVRDASQVISVVLTFWFWFTPIFYSPGYLEKAAAERPMLRYVVPLLNWNPMAHVVTGYRDCLLRMHMPDLTRLLLLAASSILVFVLGGLFFRHVKREFVDVL